MNSLAHTKWNCKYHIVFAPKYRRQVFFKEKREDIRDIFKASTAGRYVSFYCSCGDGSNAFPQKA